MSDEDLDIEIRISPQRADEFVERLISDTEFRERLAEDPLGELANYGIVLPASLLPQEVELPSPEQLAQVRDTMASDEFRIYTGGMERFGPLWAALLHVQRFGRY